MHLNPYGDDAQDMRALHESCYRSRRLLPWFSATAQAKGAMRSGLVFCLTLCQTRSSQGGLPDLLTRAFPCSSPPCEESDIFISMIQAGLMLGSPRFSFTSQSARRALEIAPIIFGGLQWLQCPRRSRAARLAFVHVLAEDCASRLFFDGRAWLVAGQNALMAFESALLDASRAAWPDAEVFTPISSLDFASGPASSWAAALAAQERLSADERDCIDSCCRRGHARGVAEASQGRL